VANKFIPKTEKIYISKIRSPPTFTNAGKVTKNVSNIALRPFYFLNSLKILAILRVLIIVIAGPPLQLATFVKTTLIPEINKIEKSNTFHPFLKYLKPYPVIFIKASNPKTQVNI
jgi:hypothetical protein